MEADVAIHPADSWTAAETGKVTYIYSNRRAERETRARLQIKASKSYDNELGSSVRGETDLASRSRTPKVKDDLSLSYGNQRACQPGVGEGHVVQAAHKPTPSPADREGTKDHRGTEGPQASGHRQDKWKPKEKSKKSSSRNKRRRRAAQQHSGDERGQNGGIADTSSAGDPQPLDLTVKKLPVEFHLKADQPTPPGPTTAHNKRPITLSSPTSLSARDSKTSPLVILEVKDGPTFYYRPSDRMVSDAGVSDDSGILSLSSLGTESSAYSGQSELSSTDMPCRASSSSSALPKHSSIGSSVDGSFYNPFRRKSSTGSASLGYSAIEGAASSAEGSPKPRRAHTQLPRPVGLRKPDLSVLNTPPRSRASTVDSEEAGPVARAHSKERDVARKDKSLELEEVSVPPATLAMSPTLTMPPPLVDLPPALLQTSASADTCGSRSDNVDQGIGTAAVAPAIGTDISGDLSVQHVSATDSVPAGPPLQQESASGSSGLENSFGFENTYQILQQRAGVKHDDIVVGPRRPSSIMMYTNFDETPVGPKQDIASVKYESFVGAGQSEMPRRQTPCGPALLSLGIHEVSSGQPILSLKTDNSEAGSGAFGTPMGLPAAVRQEGPSEWTHSRRSDMVRAGQSLQVDTSHDSVVSESRADSHASPGQAKVKYTSDSSVNNCVSDSPADGSARPRDRKSALQKLKWTKKEDSSSAAASGSASDISRPPVSDISLRIPPDEATYNTKSLDRNLRTGGPSTLKTKSATSNPAKQLHSPKAKSAIAIPTRKQPANPKLHMLSNIPVPICHDPPAKRNSCQKPQPLAEAAETMVPSFHKEKPSAEPQATSSRKTGIPVKAEDIIPQSLAMQNKSAPSALSHNSAANAHKLGGCETKGPAECKTAFDEAMLISETKEPNLVCNANDSEEVDATPKQLSTPKQNRRHINTTSTNTTSTTKLPSTAATQAEQSLLEQVTEDSSSPAPVKKRLHRSAEHLSGDAQLSIFNSADDIQFFDPASPSDKRVFKDASKGEKLGGDKISPLKKNKGLARVGIMRRGSDRTDMCRRGSERTVVPICRNDPSVEDLKKATSLKELCQSVASLLNIDNERAAEMITTSLSQRQDLVEGLDADAILDYLSHHGVLDPAILVGLDNKATITQRNSTILKHVEEHGNTAVALFINALRQSGQLHLASSLDTEQRIQPVTGQGYFGKDRHKGEVTIRVEIESLKIIAPREPRHDKIVDTSLLNTPGHDENDGVLVRDDDEDDVVKPRSCWCFCFSRKSSKAKASAKTSMEKKKKAEALRYEPAEQALPPGTETKVPEHEAVDRKDPHAKPHRTKSKDKSKKKKEKGAETAAATEPVKTKDQRKAKEKESKKSKGSKAKSKSSGKSAVPDVVDGTQSSSLQGLDSVPEVLYQSGNDEVVLVRNAPPGARHGDLGGAALEPLHQQQQFPQYNPPHQPPFNGHPSSPMSNVHKPDKDNWDPIIMEYDPKLELVKLRAGQEELASPTRQSGNIGIMCEQWKSNGRHFLQKASLLCDRIIQSLQTEIIKYFEQDRGTLVLDVISDSSAILIINICMKRLQIKQLQKDVNDESLLDKLQDMFFSKVDIHEFDIRGVKLRIVLNEQEVGIALSELS